MVFLHYISYKFSTGALILYTTKGKSQTDFYHCPYKQLIMFNVYNDLLYCEFNGFGVVLTKDLFVNFFKCIKYIPVMR